VADVAPERTQRISRRVFLGALGAAGGCLLTDLALKGPASTFLLQHLAGSEKLTEATIRATSTEAYKDLIFYFPESARYERNAKFESIQFLDENSNVVSVGTPPKTWVDREYQMAGTPESARFARVSASAYPGRSYWEDVSLKEVSKRSTRMDVYFDGRNVDSAQIFQRQETYYLRLKPEADSDRDGIPDREDPNPRIPEPSLVKPKDDVMVMAIYITSWGAKWPPRYPYRIYLKSETLTIGTELHPMRGQRYPIDQAGTYDCGDPEIADWHIKWALEHGITAFVIGWVPFSENPSGGFNHKFEDGFLRSAYRDKIKFAIDHFTDSTWDYSGEWFRGYDHVNKTARAGVDYVKENYFDYPSYLRIGKKYFYMLFRIHDYALRHGLDRFRELVKLIHDQDLYLVGDLRPHYQRNREVDKQIVGSFDAISCYNWIDAGALDMWRKGSKSGHDVWTLSAPYSSMVSGYYDEWHYWSELARDCQVDFLTPLCSGFSNRAPYDAGEEYGDNWLVERTGRTPELFKRMCLQSIPFIKKSGTDMCLIDGWNEIHECSTLEPMLEHGFDYLDAVRDAFCDRPSSGWPPNVVPTADGVRLYSS